MWTVMTECKVEVGWKERGRKKKIAGALVEALYVFLALQSADGLSRRHWATEKTNVDYRYSAISAAFHFACH